MTFKKSFLLFNDALDIAFGENNLLVPNTPVYSLEVAQKWLNVWNDKFKGKFQKTLAFEYSQTKEKKSYFFLCPLSIYKSTYDNRLLLFLEQDEDSSELEFIISEAEKLVLFIKDRSIGLHSRPKNEDLIMYSFADDKTKKAFYSSCNRTKEFLVDKATNLGYDLKFNNASPSEQNPFSKSTFTFTKIETNLNSNLFWSGTKTEVVELLKALQLSGCIKYHAGSNIGKNVTMKDLAKIFEEVLNFKITKQSNTINEIKKRDPINSTKFLDSLVKFLKKDIEKSFE